MFATDFEYDEKRLSEFDMIICSFDGASGIEPVSSGTDITYKQEKPSGSDAFHLHSCAYDSPYRICISHQEKYPIYKRGSAANHSINSKLRRTATDISTGMPSLPQNRLTLMAIL